MSVEKAIKSAKASLAVDGLYLTPAEESLIKEHLEGKISEEEFLRRVLDLVEG